MSDFTNFNEETKDYGASEANKDPGQRVTSEVLLTEVHSYAGEPTQIVTFEK